MVFIFALGRLDWQGKSNFYLVGSQGLFSQLQQILPLLGHERTHWISLKKPPHVTLAAHEPPGPYEALTTVLHATNSHRSLPQGKRPLEVPAGTRASCAYSWKPIDSLETRPKLVTVSYPAIRFYYTVTICFSAQSIWQISVNTGVKLTNHLVQLF